MVLNRSSISVPAGTWLLGFAEKVSVAWRQPPLERLSEPDGLGFSVSTDSAQRTTCAEPLRAPTGRGAGA